MILFLQYGINEKYNNMTIKRRIAMLLSTWFGIGFLKPAPGTMGSLAALPFAWVLVDFGGYQALIFAAILITAIGVWTSNIYCQELLEEDPPQVVIDEVAGQLLTLLVVPPTLIHYLFGFILFRIADIVKPWPVNWVDQNIKGGLGIMLDDILAAIYAGAGLLIVLSWL